MPGGIKREEQKDIKVIYMKQVKQQAQF